MNLNVFDVVESTNRTKTFADPDYKIIYSNEMQIKKYYCILSRFNPRVNNYKYFICFSDKPIRDARMRSTSFTRSGFVKINASNIWDKTCLKNIKDVTNINIEEVEIEDDNQKIYYLDI